MTCSRLQVQSRNAESEKTTAACRAGIEMIDCAAGCVIDRKDRNLCWVLGSEITFEVFSGGSAFAEKGRGRPRRICRNPTHPLAPTNWPGGVSMARLL